jgi:hypothetical protein
MQFLSLGDVFLMSLVTGLVFLVEVGLFILLGII